MVQLFRQNTLFKKSIARKCSVRFMTVALLAMLTSACGFHLRGDYLLPDEISTMSVTSFDQYNEITRDVKKELRLTGVTIVDPAADISNLHIASESDGDRTLSLYQNARAAEYELYYQVSYRVLVPGYGSKTFNVNITRNYLDNPLAALAKSVEKDTILDEMRVQAAQHMVRQLARLQAQLEPATELDNTQEAKDFPTQTITSDDQPSVEEINAGVEQTTSIEEVTE